MALAAVVGLHLASIPRSIWEFDESLFAMGVERYEPLLHHPPPPGYPLYMAFAKLVPADPFHALLTTSIVGLLVGLLVFVKAFVEISGNAVVGVTAAVLLYASPAVLMSGTLPQSDSGALALLGLAVWMCARGMTPHPCSAVSIPLPAKRGEGGRRPGEGLCAAPLAMGIACAAVIGWRLQLSIAVVPMFLVAVVLLRTWRERAMAVASFAIGCLAWFVPLVMATGGPESFWSWLSGQAAYYAQHDADLSRSGYSIPLIGLRFVAHPWGPKWLALPILLLAGLGLFRTRRRAILPLATGSVVYLAFAVATMDPADAVRYAIPALPFVALLAALGLRRAPWVAALYAVGAYVYAFPVLRARATTIAPPAAAAAWMERNVSRDAVIVYDLSLRPHVNYLLRGWKSTRGDVDMALPMVVLADGERAGVRGVTFRWPDSDAYRKLTRRHYGAVSVIPVPISERFRVVEGVFALERLRDGTSWRWIGARGIIELPDLGASRVRLSFRAPPEYPLDANTVRVASSPHPRSARLLPASGEKALASLAPQSGERVAEGRVRGHVAATVEVRRGTSVEIIVPYSRRILIEPDHSFVPARIRGANNRDQRTLSLMLTRVEQLDVPPSAR